MGEKMSWICENVGIDYQTLVSRKRDAKTMSKRRIVIVFFRLLGKSSVWCERVLKRDHSSILVAEKNTTKNENIQAAILIKKYQNIFGGKIIDDEAYYNIRPKIKVKVPNYHTGAIEEREVFADEYKPKFKTLQYRYKYGQ